MSRLLPEHVRRKLIYAVFSHEAKTFKEGAVLLSKTPAEGCKLTQWLRGTMALADLPDDAAEGSFTTIVA